MEAFEKVVNTPGIHKDLEENAQFVRNYRFKVKNNLPISAELIEKTLKKAGYQIVQEQKWRKG